jgi:dTDP-4-amino-4,6-dideoxygalactose transaminase
MPAYVGMSPREGSGLLEPVANLGATPVYYRLMRDLTIDGEHTRGVLSSRVDALMLVHYFGLVDPLAGELAAQAERLGIPVVEDCAHALLSDLVAGGCGRLGSATGYSLHKLLPVPSGGALRFNRGQQPDSQDDTTCRAVRSLLDFDLKSIARRRQENARVMVAWMEENADSGLRLLRPWDEQWIPQTLPVLVGDRDRLYSEMNAMGYGVVSLYHTLVEGISSDFFPDSHWLSARIMNLPVHQDMEPQRGVELLKELARRAPAVA